MRPSSIMPVVASMALLVVGCAPVESETIVDVPVPGTMRLRSEIVGDARPRATVEPRPDGASILVLTTGECRQLYERKVESRKHIARTMNGGSKVALIAGAASLALGGVWVLGATDQMPTAANPMPVSKSTQQAIGWTFAGVGAALSGLGIGSWLRARDEDVTLSWQYESFGTLKTFPCQTEPLSDKEIALATASSTSVPLGKTSRTGRLTLRWDKLERIFDSGAPPTSGSLDVEGMGTAGDLDLSAGKAFFAGREAAEAKRLALADKVDEASGHLARALALGADIVEAKAMLDAAPTTVARTRKAEQSAQAKKTEQAKTIEECFTRARLFIKRNDPDKADTELAAAEALGAEIDELRVAVANTPARRALAREEARKAEEDGRLRVAEERSGGARSPACKHALGQRGNSGRMLNVFLNGTLDRLQEAMVYSAAIRLIGKDKYPLAQALTQLDASTFTRAARGNIDNETYCCRARRVMGLRSA